MEKTRERGVVQLAHEEVKKGSPEEVEVGEQEAESMIMQRGISRHLPVLNSGQLSGPL